MRTEYLKPEQYYLWDEFVSKHKSGTIFHSSFWLNNQRGIFKIFAVFDEVNIVGGFAYVFSKKAGVKGIFRPPYTPYYHPIIENFSIDGNSEKEIVISKLIISEIKNNNLSLIFNSNTKYFFLYAQHGFKISPKLNYTLDPITFSKKISKRKRSTINRYNKMLSSGEIHIKEESDVNDLLNIWSTLGKKKSMNTYDHFIKNIFTIKSGLFAWSSLKIFNNKGKLLAGAIYMYDRKKLYNLIPVVNYGVLEKKEKNIGDFLYDRLISISLEKKLIFDFEGSEIPGVEMMYRRLGGDLDLKHVVTKYNFRLKITYFLFNRFRKKERK